MFSIGDGAVTPVNVTHHFHGDIGFVPVIAVEWTIEIPTAPGSVRANNDQLPGIGIFLQFRFPDDPVAVPAIVPVQEVDHRKAVRLLFITVGFYYDGLQILVHAVAVDSDCIDGGSACNARKKNAC